MRRFLVTTVALLITGVACGQFKANQTSTAGTQTGTLQAPAQQSLDDARRISRDEAIKMVKEGKAIWIDVRPKTDYDIGHIKGAYNVPLTEVILRMKELPPKKFLITYCA